jgi:hypothetical protein
VVSVSEVLLMVYVTLGLVTSEVDNVAVGVVPLEDVTEDDGILVTTVVPTDAAEVTLSDVSSEN